MKDFRAFETEYISGRSRDAYRYLGCHVTPDGKFRFCVYAPGAAAVRVASDANDWGRNSSPAFDLSADGYGFWTAELNFPEGALYKYEITGRDGSRRLKNDPYCPRAELRPGTASVACRGISHEWRDGEWINKRNGADVRSEAVNIYELHAGSWMRKQDGSFLNYRELGRELAAYLTAMNYTHAELMPLCEHPLDGSWGYQTGNYFAPTSRYGSPEDLCEFVDVMHAAGKGVVLDLVPGHFCRDESYLYRFDGTHLYEYDECGKRDNPLWGTANFDTGKPHVVSFLMSNIFYWLDVYHLDGIRIDAVANIIYYDHDRQHHPGPRNRFGGQENLEGIDFLRTMNSEIHSRRPGVFTSAEDSSTYPGLTAPPEYGGLGFDFKWNMGWMNDTLKYMSTEPDKRGVNHGLLTFPMLYAHTERFMLCLSHDETVHGKKNLLDKMYGPLPDKFSQFRSYLIYMYTHPGKKLLFMGSEYGQIMEWRYYESLEWKMLSFPAHRDLREFVKALNAFYRERPALYAADYGPGGFYWIDADDDISNVYSYVREAGCPGGREKLIIVCNFSDRTIGGYRLGVPDLCEYRIVFSSSERLGFGACVRENGSFFQARQERASGMPFSITAELPPYSAMILSPQPREQPHPRNFPD